MNKFCIVIPIYKSEPDYIEEVSLKRLNTVIGQKNYNVYLKFGFTDANKMQEIDGIKFYPMYKEI